MKTRLLHTKFYTDAYVLSLPAKLRFLFIFLMSNEYVGMTPYYEISPQILLLCSGLTSKELENAKIKFQQDKKLKFYKDWVFICNYEKYQSYKGDKNEIAYNRELNDIPEEIKKYCKDSVSIEYHRVDDTPINHKYKIINNKEGVVKGEEKRGIGILDDKIFVSSLREKFPEKNIELEIEKMKDWLASKGVKKSDYAAFARNWLRNNKYEDQPKLKKEFKVVDCSSRPI